MKIIVHYSGALFTRMFRALERSVADNFPEAEVIGICGDKSQVKSIDKQYAENTVKLTAWRHAVHKYAAEPVVLMDADTLVLGDLCDAFDGEFDIGLTVRDYKLRYNAGVVYVQPTENARAFIDAWWAENQFMHDNLRQVRGRVALHGGINQASLDSLLAKGDTCVIRELPCEIWNSVDQTWGKFSERTRVLHIKGGLRTLCLAEPRKNENLAALWRSYDCGSKQLVTA